MGEVPAEKDRESAESSVKDAFSESYKVESVKMMLSNLTVVRTPSDMPRNKGLIFVRLQ